MSFPEPVQGLVIRYSYLWRSEQERGRNEGSKDRPCAVILVTAIDGENRIVTVLPITHSPPLDPRLALELPAATKARLRLDGERSWVVLAEANRFLWPGPDLRPVTLGDAGSVAYGLLPYKLIAEIRHKFVGLLKERLTGIVTRTQ